MNEHAGGARPPAEPVDSIAALCAAHGPVDSAGHFSPGTLFGDWRLTAFIGRGGNGEVYCAEHSALGTPAAVKVLMREEERGKARFMREAKLLGKLKSDAFPRFLSYGEANGHSYLVMELLEPGELPTSERAIARFMLKVCDAVGELHAQGLVHRDIKPSNILWRAGTTGASPVAMPVLADLGLVKDISKSAAGRPTSDVTIGGVGTPGYGAPEQMERGEATVASDIHALGVLADRCFNGNPPRVWSRIIQRATSSIPAQRYPSVAAFANAIRWRHWFRNVCVVGFGIGLLAMAMLALIEPISKICRELRPRKNVDIASPLPVRQEGVVLAALARLDGAEIGGVQWFLDDAPIEMPYRFDDTVLTNKIVRHHLLQGVVRRGGRSYSVKKQNISPDWRGERQLLMELGEDPVPGTPIRVHAPDGTPFDFVWCPPGDATASYVAEGGTSCTARVSVGCGYWIARRELTCRQFAAIGDARVVHITPISSFARFDHNSDFPIRRSWTGYETVPSVYINGAGVMFQPPTVLQWEYAAQIGGGLPPEGEVMGYAWTRAETNGVSHWNGTLGPVFKGGQKRPNGLGMYDVYGNVAEWARVPYELKKDLPGKGRWGGWMKLGGSCADDYAGLQDSASLTARLLCGLPVHVDSDFSGRGSAGIRFVGTSQFEHETNTVQYCAAQELLRSDASNDVVRGEALLRGFIGSCDSRLDLLARECCIERGLVSLEDCGGTNAPSLLRLAAIRHGDARTLERLAVGDPDQTIRQKAYARMDNPPQMVSARCLSQISPKDGYDITRPLAAIKSLTDREALEFIVKHARFGVIRDRAVKRLLDLDANKP